MSGRALDVCKLLRLGLSGVQAHAGWDLNVDLLGSVSGQLHKHLLHLHDEPDVVLATEGAEVSEASFGSCPVPLWLWDVSEPAGGRDRRRTC